MPYLDLICRAREPHNADAQSAVHPLNECILKEVNWIRIHKSLRVTPAMAAGLSETVMDWTEIVEAMDADTTAKKRGPYKKTGEEISNMG